MTKTVTLFNPTASKKESSTPLENKAYEHQIQTVGFIDNSKPNFNFLADELETLLLTRLGVKKVIRERKNAASLPAPAEMLKRMIEECDLIIAGSGD
ncbi:hypothetical protein SAMN06296008_102154 [Polynucleobacter kasalickyi]|nr:hypothetical protein SAMN06296008_102154 [Polynucleobacter kasalickyi]